MPRPIHFEIHADDMPRARAFYEGLFGWSFAEYVPDFYYLVTTGPEAYRRTDGIAVVPAALLGP